MTDTIELKSIGQTKIQIRASKVSFSQDKSVALIELDNEVILRAAGLIQDAARAKVCRASGDS